MYFNKCFMDSVNPYKNQNVIKISITSVRYLTDFGEEGQHTWTKYDSHPSKPHEK